MNKKYIVRLTKWEIVLFFVIPNLIGNPGGWNTDLFQRTAGKTKGPEGLHNEKREV